MKHTQLRKVLFVAMILVTIASMLAACAPAKQPAEATAAADQSTAAATTEEVTTNSSSDQVVNVLLDFSSLAAGY